MSESRCACNHSYSEDTPPDVRPEQTMPIISASPAFPVPHDSSWCGGMTLRQYAAIHAMQGFLSNSDAMTQPDMGPRDVARSAWDYADALLATESPTRSAA